MFGTGKGEQEVLPGKCPKCGADVVMAPGAYCTGKQAAECRHAALGVTLSTQAKSLLLREKDTCKKGIKRRSAAMMLFDSELRGFSCNEGWKRNQGIPCLRWNLSRSKAGKRRGDVAVIVV